MGIIGIRCGRTAEWFVERWGSANFRSIKVAESLVADAASVGPTLAASATENAGSSTTTALAATNESAPAARKLRQSEP